MTRLKILLPILLLLVAAVFVFSSVNAQPAQQAKEVTLQGTIIDSACAGAHKADLNTFIKSHTKECALMPACEKSGYNLYSGGTLYKFDETSSARVAEFLKKTESKLEVRVKATEDNGSLALISIDNQ